MAAPKGNQYAIGNDGGRPRVFEDPEEIARLANDYFEYIRGEKDENGKYTRDPEPATITGLALYLGFASRKSLQEYMGREEFTAYISKARLRVEHEYEKRLQGNNVAGLIFALKNMGWADYVNNQLTGANGSPLMPNAVTISMPAGIDINMPSNLDGEQ